MSERANIQQAQSNIKELLTLIQRLNQVKGVANYHSRDMVKMFLKLTDQDYNENDDILDGDFAADKAFEAFEAFCDKINFVSQDIKQSIALNASLQQQLTTLQSQDKNQAPKPSERQVATKSHNFDHMITVTQRIVKLQAWFRKLLTLKRLNRELRDSKMGFQQRKQLSSPEEQAIKELSQQLVTKNLTPESFFRICDPDYKQSVPVGVFKDMIQKLGLKLSRGQLSRLILILDEDMEGNITREEYYNALEAYNVSGEKHKSLDGSLYHPFEHRALFKLIIELKRKNISFLEMFQACDINDDTRVNISEIQNFVSGLSSDIKQKEIHALMNYLDIDKNGLVDKDEFLRQLNKGEQTYRQSQALNKQIQERPTSTSNIRGSRPQLQQDNFFEENDVGGGTQTMFGFVDNMFGGKKNEPKKQDQPPSRQNQQPKSKQLDPDTLRRKQIIERMERDGQNFTSFFQSIKPSVQNGAIQLGVLLKALDQAYTHISSQDRSFLVQICQKDARKVDYIELESLFTRFSKVLMPSTSQTFSVIANNIVKMMGAGVSPSDAIKQFFKAQSLRDQDEIGQVKFVQMFSRIGTLGRVELEQAFVTADTDYDDFVKVIDLIRILISYCSQEEKPTLNVKEIGRLIPGFETMSPRSRQEELIQLIISELSKKNLKPLNIFKMADITNQGQVQVQVLEQTFKKMLPTVLPEIIRESMQSLISKSQRDMVSRQDFTRVFSESGTYIPNSQSLQRTANTPSKIQSSSPDEEAALAWIRKLDNAMLREKVSPGVAFRAADINHNGVVTIEELKESIKKLIPQEALSLLDLKNIMASFDQNNNQVIEESEFIGLIEKARNSNLTIIETPQKQGRSMYEEDRSSGLPTKNFDPSRQAQNFQTVDQIIESLEKKVNLKKLFGELNLQENGNILLTQASQRLKNYKSPKDGSGIAPSEYMPLLKSLDQSLQGQFHVKDLLRQLERYAISFDTDCQLELKYMANFIEFQMRNQNTVQFFLQNSRFLRDRRLLEAEFIIELNKVFGISNQSARLVFSALTKQLMGQDIQLSYLAQLIDQYRLVQVRTDNELSKTQSSKIDSSKVLLKFGIGIVGLNPRRREILDKTIDEIISKEGSIPFFNFFNLFESELKIIDHIECKALFETLCKMSKNTKQLEPDVFQKQVIGIQGQIRNAQVEALAESVNAQGEKILKDLTLIKMNDLGYMSKNGFKEHLMNYNVINKPGTQPQDSLYALRLKSLLNYEFVISEQLQANEYVNQYLIDELDTCRFWVLHELMAKLARFKEHMTPLLLKYLGKLFDYAAPNKTTYNAMQELCPQSLFIQDGKSIANMYLKLEEAIKRRVPGFDQGQIKDQSMLCLQAIHKQLGDRPIKIENEENSFIRALNKNRAYLPQKSSFADPMSESLNDRDISSSSVSMDQIVLRVEKSINQKLEKALEYQYSEDQITLLKLSQNLAKMQQQRDLETLKILMQKLDPITPGIITTQELVLKLKQVSGKYNQEAVIAQFNAGVEGSIESFFKQSNIQPNMILNKNDFLDTMKDICNLSDFHILCMFYELEKGAQAVKISDVLSFFVGSKPAKSNLQQSPQRNEEKKHVRFGGEDQPKRDEERIKAICKLYHDSFSKIVSDSERNIKEAVVAFKKYLEGFKSSQNAIQQLSPNGETKITVDVLKLQIESIRELSNLSELQQVVLVFLYANTIQNDVVLVDLEKCIRFVRAAQIDIKMTPYHEEILRKVFEAIKNYLGIKKGPSPLRNQEKGPSPLRKQEKVVEDKSKLKKQNTQQKIDKQKIKMGPVLERMRDLFKDPENVKIIEDIFKTSKTHSMYYRRFKYFLHDVDNFDTKQAVIEKCLEKTESLMDLNETGKIYVFDFLDFCERYDVSFQSEIGTKIQRKLDKRAQTGDRMTCGPLEYFMIPKQDYYRGMPTILNNEKAALVMAQKIYDSLADDEEFYDKEFGPKDDDDEEGNKMSLYCNGTPPRGYISPDQIKWIRPEEMPIDKTPVFIDDGAAANDVKQGKIGDCWFIGALSVLAMRDDLLRGGVGSLEIDLDEGITQEHAQVFSDGVYPPLFHIYKKKGIYVFRFFKEFAWRYVIIDDRIPCFEGSKRPVFGQCSQMHELWVPLLEKAYAKLHGCYESLISGFIDDALSDMTGLVAEKIFLHNEQKKFPHKQIVDKDKFWDFLMRQRKLMSMMGCSVVGDVERQICIDGFMTGIMTGHAYGLIDIFEIFTGPQKQRRRLLRVRNPWGEMEWQGKWSDASDEIQTYRKEIMEQYISTLDPEDRFTLGENDGTFLINYANWRDIFNNMYICCDFPLDWSAVRFKGEWKQECSGGLPSPMTEENMIRWSKNPQYLFETEEPSEIFISLAQPDGRVVKEGKYYKFPYSELIHQVIFSVFKVADNHTGIMKKFDRAALKGSSVLKEHREVSLRLHLEPGKYVIVPCTRNPGECGVYTLSIYFDQDVRDVEIKRLDLEEDEFTLIEEETERFDNIEQWKLDLCQERVQEMIETYNQRIKDQSMNASQLINTSNLGGKLKMSMLIEAGTAKTKNNDISFNEAFPKQDDDIE